MTNHTQIIQIAREHRLSRRSMLRASLAATGVLVAPRIVGAAPPASSRHSQYVNSNVSPNMENACAGMISQWLASVSFTPSGGWLAVSGAGNWGGEGIEQSCINQVTSYFSANNPVNCVAFPPAGGWVVAAETATAATAGIPSACWSRIVTRVGNGEEVICVAFTPSGGWVVLSDASSPATSGIPSACVNALNEAAASPYTWPEHVAFTPSGGWLVLGRGGYIGGVGVPNDCWNQIIAMRETAGRRVTRVAFAPNGAWHVSANDMVQMPVPSGPLNAVKDLMATVGIPGVQVAVIEGNVVTRRHNYGVVHRGSRFAVHSGTRFQCASVSKVVASAGALRALRLGLLGLGTNIDTDLRSFLVPSYGSTVNLRRILSHSNGFTVSGFNGYRRPLIGSIPSTLGILQGSGNSPAVAQNPRTIPTHVYSGGGFVVLQHLIEQASGQAFSNWMGANLLTPLGMNSSAFVIEPSWRNADLATGHLFTSYPVESRRHAYPEFAAAGLYTTASDLAQLLITINQLGVAPNGTRLWFNASGVQMLTQQATSGGGVSCGLGVFLNGTTYLHTGINVGFRSLVWADSATGNGVVVLSNYDEIDANGANVSTSVEDIAETYIANYGL